MEQFICSPKHLRAVDRQSLYIDSFSCPLSCLDGVNAFNPLDRAQYKKRLGLLYFPPSYHVDTYTVFKWFAMPDQLSPVICASHGWENVARNTLQCPMYASRRLFLICSCKNKVIVKLDPTLSFNAFNNCVEAYKEDLSHRHAESCPWYNMQSCENLSDPLNAPRSELMKDFEKRLTEFLKIHVCLLVVLFSLVEYWN